MAAGATTRLRKLLESIFEDGHVDAKERAALAATTGGGELSPAQVRQVFDAFVDAKWGEVMADGFLSHSERLLMVEIVRELHIEEASLPSMLRMAIYHDN